MSKAPFRFDIVGSFLRPPMLKEARQAFYEGKLDADGLQEVEDRCIRELMDKETEVGLHAVTDGEFRRKWWHLDFIAALNGITKFDIIVDGFGAKGRKMEGSYVSGPLSFPDDHPFLTHFKRNNIIADGRLVKQTIPGPGMIYLSAMLKSKQYRENPIYDSREAFEDALIKTYRDAIQAFYDAGCRYLQLDDTSWGSFFSKEHVAGLEALGYDVEDLVDRFAHVMAAAIDNKPADLSLTTHMCKGNFMSNWLYEGSYERIASRLLAIEKFDGFFLEYDDDRSGSFEPLRHLKNQRIVLGLVTTKTGDMEDRDTVLRRIDEAAKIVPLERICISPQCGFASTEEGNVLAYESQWDKLRFLRDIAEEVWDD